MPLLSFLRRGPTQEDSAKEVAACLTKLQKVLPGLNDAQKAQVGGQHEFATEEWLDALSHGMEQAAGPRVMTEDEFCEARVRLTADSKKLMLVLVGLPARGKSTIGWKLQTFLSWYGYKTKCFSVGAARREVGQEGSTEHGSNHFGPGSEGRRSAHTAASFFDSSKAYAAATREAVALEVLASTLRWFDRGGQIAVFDATNTSLKRRRKLAATIEAHSARQVSSRALPNPM